MSDTLPEEAQVNRFPCSTTMEVRSRQVVCESMCFIGGGGGGGGGT